MKNKSLKTITMLSCTAILTLGLSCAASAKSYLWLLSGATDIKQGKVFQSENMTVQSGKHEGRIHSIDCKSSGYVYMTRNTKGWIFWSEEENDKKYFSAENQYRYFDLGKSTKSKKTYYTATNFANQMDAGSKVNVRVNEISVTICD